MKKLQILSEKLTEKNLDAIALLFGQNMAYFTGLEFHGSERPTVAILTKEGKTVFVVPEFEKRRALEAIKDATVISYGENPDTWQAAFDTMVKATGAKINRLGIEAYGMRYFEYDKLRKALPDAEFVSADDLFFSMRMIKSADEEAKMVKAAKIAQDALLATLPKIKLGVSEKQIAAELIYQLIAHGSEPEMAFLPIVASGPSNSANPHASPSDRRLENGDMLVIDYGARYEGYNSDITRTFVIGEVSEKQREIYETVKAANAAGKKAAVAGRPVHEIDDAARKVIVNAGYGEFFTHRTGHGIGRETHEHPYIYDANKMILEVGMTFTVEPGIYVPGVGGVRIEDDVICTTEGGKSLVTLDRELKIL